MLQQWRIRQDLRQKEGTALPRIYSPEFRKKIVRLHREEGRTSRSLTAGQGASRDSIARGVQGIQRRMPERSSIRS